MCCRPALLDLQRVNIFVIKNWSHDIPVNWLIHTNSRAVCVAFKCLFRLVLPPTLWLWGIFPSSVLSVLCFPFCWIINCVHDNWLPFLFLFWRKQILNCVTWLLGLYPHILWSILSFFPFPSHQSKQTSMCFKCQPPTCIKKNNVLTPQLLPKVLLSILVSGARATVLGFIIPGKCDIIYQELCLKTCKVPKGLHTQTGIFW